MSGLACGILSMILVVLIVISLSYSIVRLDLCNTNFDIITSIIGIIIFVSASLGLIQTFNYWLDKNDSEIIKSGEYNGLKLFDNDSDSVIVEITATIDDQQVKRTSKYTLKGRDFSDSEINETNKALNNLVISMLKTRQDEVDSIRRLYGTKDNAEKCDLITKNNNVYRLCKVD